MANYTNKYTSPTEKEIRIGEAAKWLLDNPSARWTDFIDHFKAKWDLTQRMVAHYYKDAQKKVSELVDENILAEKSGAAIHLSNMMRKAEKEGDMKLALEYRKEVNKVMGLYTTNIDVTSGGEKMSNFDLSKIVGFSEEEDTDERSED